MFTTHATEAPFGLLESGLFYNGIFWLDLTCFWCELPLNITGHPRLTNKYNSRLC